MRRRRQYFDIVECLCSARLRRGNLRDHLQTTRHKELLKNKRKKQPKVRLSCVLRLDEFT